MDDEEGILWAGFTTIITLGAAALARKLMAKTWTKRKGFVPGPPGDGKTTWREAALFAVVSGAAVGLSRLLADRVAQEVKMRSSSHPA